MNSSRMNGQPCIRNLRMTVRRIIELLVTYTSSSQLVNPLLSIGIRHKPVIAKTPNSHNERDLSLAGFRFSIFIAG
jgi:hypothetical protein